MFRRGVTVKRFGVGCISGGPCGLTRGQRVRFGPDSFGLLGCWSHRVENSLHIFLPFKRFRSEASEGG